MIYFEYADNTYILCKTATIVAQLNKYFYYIIQIIHSLFYYLYLKDRSTSVDMYRMLSPNHDQSLLFFQLVDQHIGL
jgi:hypothetical protein